jgi:phytanoyl-CoA hydroxylase
MNTNPNHFNQYGYVVMKGLIPLSKIDECVTSLEEFKKSKYQIYFSQSRHVWTRANHITKTGFLAESIQHSSKLIFSRRIQEAVIEVITDHEISTALKSITGYEDFIRWQDMLFDKSTGTVDHADNWYLDTFPSDNMVGSWIALDDIHEDAGRFFVVPESNHLSLPTYSEAISHEDYLKVVHNEITSKGLSRYAPELRKGDVLFWHSKTIHGSLSQKMRCILESQLLLIIILLEWLVIRRDHPKKFLNI